MTEKLMVLGAGVYQIPLIAKAKEMGMYVVVVSPGSYPGMALADKVIDCDIKDEEGVYRAAAAEGVQGIISDETDMPLLSMAYAAQRLGLPGNSYECAKLFTDKYLMREKCRQLGLPSIEYRLVTEIDEARDFLRQLGRPAIIKPVDSGGSKGVTRIDTEADLEEHFQEAKGFSGNGTVIIERFIRGREFEVDAIALHGKVKTLMYADLESFDLPNVFASTTRLYPSVADPSVVDRLLELDRAVVEGFGLSQGLTHDEYIMDEEDGQIYLLEAAARGGGTHISTSIAQLQTGLNTSEFLVNIALGRLEEIPPFRYGRCHCGYVAFYIPQGEVISTRGIEEVQRLDFVEKTTMDSIHQGMKAASFSDKRLRHAVILYGDSRRQLEERIRTVRQMLQIKVRTPDGIRGLIWE